MKKFENLGRVLNKEAQKKINGGDAGPNEAVTSASCNNYNQWHTTYAPATTIGLCRHDLTTHCTDGCGNCSWDGGSINTCN